MREPLPLTAGDLRDLAEALDEVEQTTLAANRIVGRIEFMRPDDEVGEVIGHAVRFDDSDPDMGWGIEFN